MEHAPGLRACGRQDQGPGLERARVDSATAEQLANEGKAKGIINNGVSGTKMKAYKDKLSADEIDALAAYVTKL